MKLTRDKDGEYTLKNFRLVEARDTKGLKRKDVASQAGLSKQMYTLYETMKVKPNQHQKYRIAQVLGESVEYLFPKVIENHYKSGAKSWEVYDYYVRNGLDTEMISKERGIEGFINKDTATTRVEKISEVLDPLEKEVIGLRYWLKEGYSHKVKEVAEIIGTTKEKVRIIEFRAVEKLRNSIKREFVIQDF